MRRRNFLFVSTLSVGITLCLEIWMYKRQYSDEKSVKEAKDLKKNKILENVLKAQKIQNVFRNKRKHLINDIHHRMVIPPIRRNQRPISLREAKSFREVKEDFVGFYENATHNVLSDPLLHFHNFKFLLNNPLTCSTTQGVLFVTCVHSAPDHFLHRTRIRDTCASLSFLNGFSLPVVFIVGQVSDPNIQREINRESSTHGDIIQGNFIDSYRNLTYKNVFGLHWVLQHCNSTKFVVKIDDDVLINPYHVIAFLNNIKKLNRGVDFIMCSMYVNQGPVRYSSDKWFIPREEYPYSKFPNYCEGYAYVLSVHAVKTLYQTSTLVPFFWVDDVYVTGFLPYVARIKHQSFTVHHSSIIMRREYSQSELNCTMFYLAKHRHNLQYWEMTWKNITEYSLTKS